MSWIFSIICIIATYLIGKKIKWGWVLGNISALGFIYIYLKNGIYGGIVLDIFLLIVNTINFFKWHKSKKMKHNEIKIKLSSNPFRKGEIIKLHNNAETPIKVVKVYDHIWWRKFVIWIGWMKPSFTLKAKGPSW